MRTPFFSLAAATFLNCIALSVQSHGQSDTKRLTIIHTNDLQSRLLGFGPNHDFTPLTTGDDHTIGGIARVATVIKSIKSKSPESTLVIDGGDFLMGTLFHTICREEAAELRIMAAIGYDAATFGNHEFDFRPDGLARTLSTARRHGRIPQLLLSNIVFDPNDPGDDSLGELFERKVIKPYTVFKRNGLRIGVFGLMGKDAAEVSPFAAPVTFSDPIFTARKMAAMLRQKDSVDVVICASHGGVQARPNGSWGGEDVNLAKAVPEIDVIVGGHSHTLLKQPVMVRGIPVLQAGSEGRYVGVLELKVDNGVVSMEDYRIIPIDDTIEADREIQTRVDGYVAKINQSFLSPCSLTLDQVVAETGFDLTIHERESNLGNLVADAIRWGVDQRQFLASQPETRTAIAIESNGMIRDDLLKGQSGLLQVSDLFRVVPLGIGMIDESPGYPLISFYLRAKEIKAALEVLTSIYPLKGSSYFLQVSGLRFRYNPNRIILDRVLEVELSNAEGSYETLDLSSSNKELYKVACNIYVGAFIKVVGSFTSGVLKIVPKDGTGKAIVDLNEALVDADTARIGIQEAKEWECFVNYVRSFGDANGNGVPDIPDDYRGTQDRIVRFESWNPVLLYRNATYVSWGLTAAGALILIGLSLASRLIYVRFGRRS